jgi:UDP-N-acetylglucosamine:LPS N-acetylglucosamine transferase
MATSVKALLVTSSGGHLAQVMALEPWWSGRERRWVSAPTLDARHKLVGEDVVWAYHPTTRNLPNLLRNLRLAYRQLRSYRPDVVVSTGAGVAVPFFWLARLMGARTVFIEVLDRVDSRTLTGMLCYPVTDLFLVQWEDQQRLWRNSSLVGRLL